MILLVNNRQDRANISTKNKFAGLRFLFWRKLLQRSKHTTFTKDGL